MPRVVLSRSTQGLFFLFCALGFAFLLTPQSAEAAKLAGGNAHPDQVWFNNTLIFTDLTAPAISIGANDITLVGALGSTHYVGSESKFDKVIYNIGVAGTLGTVVWEYWNGSTWSAISGVSDGTNGFLNPGFQDVTFTVPSDWATTAVNSVTKYYIRARTSVVYGVVALGTQISVRNYNLKIKAQDELGNVFTGLTSANFSAADGTDNIVYGVRELGSGTYEVSLDATEADTNFTLTVTKDGYVNAAATTGSLTTTLTDLSGSAISLPFGFKVTAKTQDNVTASGGTVTAGNSFGTTCTESGSSGVYYCPVPLADTALAVRFQKSFFDTNTSNSFPADRTANADAQITVTINNIAYSALTGLSTNANSLEVFWTATSDTNFQKYEVYHSLSPGVTSSNGNLWGPSQDANLSVRTTASTKIVGFLSTGLKYYLVVYVFDANGNKSLKSAEVTLAPPLGGGGGGEGAGKKETTFSSLTLTLTASPDVIEPGGSSTLVWQSNATNCIASGGWSGGKSASGQETVKPNLTADYTLTCSRQSETVSKIMKITLLGQQQTEENLPSQNPSPPIENPVAANPVEPLFSRDLLFGERSQEVRKLQELLATDRSLYPEGLVTGYFGRLTQLALGRFQVRYGLVTSTTPGREEYRRVGIATRRKLAEVFGSGNGSGSQVLEPSRKLYRALRFGSRGEDVRVLQEFLASDPAIYPQRLVTGYFGRFTRLAVIRFQQKYNTPQLQTERGIVGPYTLIKLDEMLE